ncbi:MAG: type I DNA topoisomerase [Candidatus Pacebacteria bacterium]|nr:type I DNA topoisomerase [Candidatus Paceibacterota bacterium]
MKLVIVESPAKAKTIEKYLGDGYTVKASVGHVRDLPKSNKNAIDIEAGFVPNYQIVPEKKEIIHDLKTAAAKADEIILATDPDREGEAIAWHLVQALGLEESKVQSPKSKQKKNEKKFSRIAFHEITKEAIQEAMKHPRAIDQNLRQAQEARRVLDRLVGYDLSGLIWKKVRYGLSAGRVQSPALRILMEREREIRAFIPETFWVLTASVTTKKGDLLTIACEEEPTERTRVDEILTAGKKASWSIADVKETEVARNPRAPFTTSTIQQSASTRLGFSPSRTMRAAQKLYEAGHITYMRTDSTNIGAAAQAQLIAVATERFGKEYVRPASYKSKSKNAQEAHEAIRPTNASKEHAGNTDDEKKLYELILARSLASQMAPAGLMQTKITTTTDNTVVPAFSVTGSRVIFPGWLVADPRARGEDVELPKVDAGEGLSLKELSDLEKQTQPPNRYSEAGLIKELEKRGIGRPSTYAAIIRTIEERGYVIKEGRTLIPTDTGDVVSSFIEKYFADYISDSFTSEMEDELDEIARGERDYTKTLKDFYTPFAKEVAKKTKDAGKITDLGPAPKEFPCPICKSAMVIKLGKNGKFMSCDRFPECDGARTINGEEMKAPESIGKDPATGEPIFVLTGPYGPYVQMGIAQKKEKGSKVKVPKPRRASIPKDKIPEDVTLEEALKYLSLPRELGIHPESSKPVVANIGRFGPYIGHDGDFRSLKTDDPYTITFERALEILKEPKKVGRGRFAKKKK